MVEDVKKHKGKSHPQSKDDQQDSMDKVGTPKDTPQSAPKDESLNEKSNPGPEVASKEAGESDALMVAVSMEEYNQMQQDLEQSRRDVATNFEGWQRERADFANYKRRIERDQATIQNNLKGEVIKKYLVIVDDLERALKACPKEGEGAAWAEGVELIYRKLQNILESEGVTRISAENEWFDPTLHEAVTHEDCPGCESGRIIEVLQQGYCIGDRVLRPALVRVAR